MSEYYSNALCITSFAGESNLHFAIESETPHRFTLNYDINYGIGQRVRFIASMCIDSWITLGS